jgi:predicted nucleotidyltransferase
VSDVDAIHWLRLTDEQVARLHRAVGEVVSRIPEVVAAYHYGSSARGRPARDIDVALVVDRGALHTVDADDVAARIAIASSRSVDELDVRIVNDADPVFLGNLMREGRRCFERDVDSRVAFEVRAMNAWLDFQPAWQRLRRRVLEVWSRG